MQFFNLVEFQDMVLAFFLGLLLLVLVYIAWATYPQRDHESEERKEVLYTLNIDQHELPPRPVPPFLVFIFVGVTLWAIAYAIMRGIFGGPIW